MKCNEDGMKILSFFFQKCRICSDSAGYLVTVRIFIYNDSGVKRYSAPAIPGMERRQRGYGD